MDLLNPVDQELLDDDPLKDEEPDMPSVRVELQEAKDDCAVFHLSNIMDIMDLTEMDREMTYYSKEQLLNSKSFGYLDDDDDDDSDDGGKTPFEKIAAKLTNVTPDGKVKKKVIDNKVGHGPVVPKNAYVTINYQAWVEYGEDPYDSTWMRGQPLKCRLQRGYLIPGLEIAIATMKKGESARFLIHPDLAYKELGCPPRIPPDAELLFEVELVDFMDNIAAEAFESLSMEDRQNADFDVVLKAAKAQHLTGNDLFNKGMIGVAIARYMKAVESLERCSLRDEEDEKKQQSMLLKLYVNLGVCYNKDNKPRKACLALRSALKINPMSAKAQFNFGRALIMLSDYKEAERRLLKAQKLEPNNKAITEELKKLEKKKNSYQKEQKMFAEQMFKKAPSKGESETKKSEVSEAFESEVMAFLKDFVSKDMSESQVALPAGLTAQEELCVRQKAESLGVSICYTESRGERTAFLKMAKPTKEDGIQNVDLSPK